jgi:hypothetical protein
LAKGGFRVAEIQWLPFRFELELFKAGLAESGHWRYRLLGFLRSLPEG